MHGGTVGDLLTDMKMDQEKKPGRGWADVGVSSAKSLQLPGCHTVLLNEAFHSWGNATLKVSWGSIKKELNSAFLNKPGLGDLISLSVDMKFCGKC